MPIKGGVDGVTMAQGFSSTCYSIASLTASDDLEGPQTVAEVPYHLWPQLLRSGLHVRSLPSRWALAANH
jgi:hypothetical protein